MARPRVNDPENTRMPPNLAAPERVPVILDGFWSRVGFLATNYRYGKQFLGNSADFNRSLKRLRSALSSGGFTRRMSTGAIASGKMARLHPELELVITARARSLAAERGGDNARVTAADISAAAQFAASHLEIRRGAPPDSNLRHHVEALVALVQEVTGRPVLVEKMRGVDYDPHFMGQSGQVVLSVIREWEPLVEERKVARMVLDARKRLQGGRMAFSDYFPGYGSRPAPDGSRTAPPCFRIERFEPVIPIYCPYKAP